MSWEQHVPLLQPWIIDQWRYKVCTWSDTKWSTFDSGSAFFVEAHVCAFILFRRRNRTLPTALAFQSLTAFILGGFVRGMFFIKIQLCTWTFICKPALSVAYIQPQFCRSTEQKCCAHSEGFRLKIQSINVQWKAGIGYYLSGFLCFKRGESDTFSINLCLAMDRLRTASHK